MVQLTDRQRDAAHHYLGPAIVIAGPGSGKTRVLIERIKFLIEEKKTQPNSILAVTFTEKAAEEMSTRLFLSIGENAKAVHVSTIHSLCKTIMEDHFVFQDFGASFNILDSENQKLFIIANRYRLGLNGPHGWRNLISKAAGFAGNPEDQVCLLYNTITENDIKPKALAAVIEKMGVETEDGRALIESYKRYVALLRAEKLVDFAHLESIALKMLSDIRAVRTPVQERFRFVLVDEYQDTNPIQNEIIRHIVSDHKNIFVVGDENQSIYGFRGAVRESFTQFSCRYPETKSFTLNTNFRSTKNIVDTANKLLEAKIKEKLEAHRSKGNEIILINGENRRAVAQNAVLFLKKKIAQGKLSIGDCAFLYRKRSLATDVTAALQEHGLAFATDSDGRFLERKEIRDVINIFSYLHQSLIAETRFKDWSDWWRPDLFDNEVISFSRTTLDVLRNLPRNSSLNAINSDKKASALGIRNRKDSRVLVELNLAKKRIEENEIGLLDALYEIFKLSGYLSLLFDHPCPENEEKLLNLAQLTRIVDGYQRRFSRPSAKDLLWLLYNKTMDKGMDQVFVESTEAAKCMTVHKAKGLEFPAVVVCSLIEGDFPLRYREKEPVCGIPIPDNLMKIKTADEKRHFEEELRLLYVAITRAQDLLMITVPEKINVRKARPSRFIEMIKGYVTEEIDTDIRMDNSYISPLSVTSLSYSAVHTYRDCPFRYKINYFYGFASSAEPMQRQGVIIHNVLQKVNWALKNGKKVTKGDIQGFINGSWIPIYDEESDEKLKKSYLGLTLKYLAFAVKEFREIHSFEKPFVHIDGTTIVRGKVDLVARDNTGKNTLVDFKARTREGIEETGVKDQLGIYRHCLVDTAIQRMATYTFFDSQCIDFDYDDGTAKSLLSSVSDGLKAKSFPLNKDPSRCPACHYQFICKELGDGKSTNA